MAKIRDKKFMKNTKNTMLDFDDAVQRGSLNVIDIRDSLQDILKHKRLTIQNTMEIIPYLENFKEKGYHNILNELLQNGHNINVATRIVSEITNEHEYMYKILSQYFEWKQFEGCYAISFKNNEGEVA